MGAIWHDHGMPSFMAVGPRFSFFEQAIVVEVAPISWSDARRFFEREQARLGIGPEQHQAIAKQARAVYMAKRPWWVTAV